MSPGSLDDILCGLQPLVSPQVLVGLQTPDDAAVYKLSDELALVQTVDFFTPIVDDPFAFGQIAAANALSDIYAMGARPVTALNLVAFPVDRLDRHILKEILRGGIDKLNEAGVSLVGGHSIDDEEIKYGLAVTGLVHPRDVLTKQGAQPGDLLFLSKPLGTGIIATALKAGMASTAAVAAITRSMATLNRAAGEVVHDVGVHACTDITGFGLVGHAMEVARASGRALRLRASGIPVFDEARSYALTGLVPAGAHNNRAYYEPRVVYDDRPAPDLLDVLFDPQTSGGLFFSMAPEKRGLLEQRCREKGVTVFCVGEVLDGPAGNIILQQ